jgi:hypothetical protein
MNLITQRSLANRGCTIACMGEITHENEKGCDTVITSFYPLLPYFFYIVFCATGVVLFIMAISSNTKSSYTVYCSSKNLQ